MSRSTSAAISASVADRPAAGAGEILLTSMDRDGTRQGFDTVLTRAIADAVSVPVIASGGVGTLDHLVDDAADRFGSQAVVVAIDAYRVPGTTGAGQRWGVRQPSASSSPARITSIPISTPATDMITALSTSTEL